MLPVGYLNIFFCSGSLLASPYPLPRLVEEYSRANIADIYIFIHAYIYQFKHIQSRKNGHFGHTTDD